jgi:diguanylate cyclase (GGDEF)-like protein
VFWDDRGVRVATNSIPQRHVDLLTDGSVYEHELHGDAHSVALDDVRSSDVRDVARALGYRTVWIIPILDDHEVALGVILIWSAIERRGLIRRSTPYAMATGLARLALVEHRRRRSLMQRAQRDELTGVRNRHGLAVALDDPRAATASGALFVDLDDFKRINDELGHAAGDVVLAEVAMRLTSQTRAFDIVARLGGDEFVLITAQDDEAELRVVADRILELISEPIDVGGDVVALTASIGIAVGLQGDDVADLLDRADRAMYLAKRTGKGQAVVDT